MDRPDESEGQPSPSEGEGAVPEGDEQAARDPGPEQATLWPQPLRFDWAPPPVDPTTEKYDPGEHREHTRAQLAGGLAILLGIVGLALVFLTAFNALSLDEAKDLATAVLSPIVVLTGTALGFYFGVHQNGR